MIIGDTYPFGAYPFGAFGHLEHSGHQFGPSTQDVNPGLSIWGHPFGVSIWGHMAGSEKDFHQRGNMGLSRHRSSHRLKPMVIRL